MPKTSTHQHLPDNFTCHDASSLDICATSVIGDSLSNLAEASHVLSNFNFQAAKSEFTHQIHSFLDGALGLVGEPYNTTVVAGHLEI